MFSIVVLSSLALASLASAQADPVSLNILSKTGQRNATAPYLYGWMFEDINHSGEGGIYGELLTNRAFEGSNVGWGSGVAGFPAESVITQENTCEAYGPVLTGYKPAGNTSLRLDYLRPLSASHQYSLAVDIPTYVNQSTDRVGFQNMGWWGIPVIPQTYTFSFYIYPSQARNFMHPNNSITVSLQSNLTGEVFASTVIPGQNWNLVNWTYVCGEIVVNTTAPNSNNTFAVTFDPIEAAGQTYFFNEISLFGETFKGYKNGLRKDIAETLYDLGPKFLRWPGGNNIEGYSIQRRWKWWETIGPLKDRVPRPGNWGYMNSNGLGLMEFLEWTEAMEMENILGIYSGYSLQEGAVYPGDEFPPNADAMYPLLKEALDELEFIMGDANTTYWGAKRAEYGHPEPFDIKFIEIGNEDWFADYAEFRINYMHDGLKAAYPNITYIYSAYNENAKYNVTLPAGVLWDTHHYEEPKFFINNFNFWDNWQERTNNPDIEIFIGEYSVIQFDTPSGSVNYSFPADVHVFYSGITAAVAEGVYLLGAERNPNVVKLTSYAPSLQNLNWYNWTPDLFAFDADPSHTILSASYYLQKMLAHHRGTESLTVNNAEGDFGPLYWASSINGAESVYLKVINVNDTTVPLTVNIENTWSTVNGTILTTDGDPNAYNALNNQTAIMPATLNISNAAPASDGSWKWDVPRYSITILEFKLS